MIISKINLCTSIVNFLRNEPKFDYSWYNFQEKY